jgi:hypothetical protein
MLTDQRLHLVRLAFMARGIIPLHDLMGYYEDVNEVRSPIFNIDPSHNAWRALEARAHRGTYPPAPDADEICFLRRQES